MSQPTARMQIQPIGALADAVWDEVWELSRRFYQSERGWVEARLKQHQELALYRSTADGSLVGMAAIQVDAMEFQGQKLLVIFTSHAIIDECYRGQNLMQRAGVRTYLRCCLRHPLRRKLWAFDTFSYKSYWLLPRNLREFWPRRDQPTPAWQAAFMDYYGRLKYGDAWRGGVIQGSAHKRLLPQTAALNEALMKDPDLAFFARANPGHAEGDMLLCLIPLTLANWWGIVSRAVWRAWHRPG
jgi:hypothetical protein